MSGIVLSTPNWLKVLIRSGTALFVAAVPGIYAAYYVDGIYSIAGLLMVSALAFLFGYFGYRGFLLCKFLDHEVHIFDGQVHISHHGAVESFPLVGRAVEFDDRMEEFGIYRRDGSLAYRVDYIGQDIESLRAIIDEHEASAA